MEFAVLQPNALMSCAPGLTLRTGVSSGEEGSSGGGQGAGPGKAANARGSLSSIAGTAPAGAAAAGSAAAAANVLRVALKPVGPGGCPPASRARLCKRQGMICVLRQLWLMLRAGCLLCHAAAVWRLAIASSRHECTCGCADRLVLVLQAPTPAACC